MRKLGALVLAGMLLAGLVGCSSSKKTEDVKSEGTTEETKDDSKDKKDESTDKTTDDAEDDSTDDTSADDGDDSSSGVPLSFEDCLEVSLTYAGIYLSTLSFDESAKTELEAAIDEIGGKVPDDIKDDLQVIADGIAESNDFVEISEFFETDEYKEADANITEYLDEVCGSTSG